MLIKFNVGGRVLVSTIDVRERPKSWACYERARALIPAGVQSPVRAFSGLDLSPLVVDIGVGDEIVDVDGNRYIDYCCSWGALLHGHAHPEVVRVASERIVKGSSFGITTPVEAELAQHILEHLPAAEMVRFVSSGTEATMTAIRLARGFTGKERIVKFAGHYHGHADSFLVQAGSGCLFSSASSAGVPHELAKLTLSIPFNDVEALLNVLEHQDIAALILEPIAANMGVVPPDAGFLELIREETAKRGIVLIFDEVITGFRIGIGGAAGHYGLEPDLTCLGKIIGGGFPAAAVAGRREIMNKLAPLGPVYQAGTLSGNPVAMAAGLKTLELLEEEHFYQTLKERTQFFIQPILEVIQDKDLPACLHHVGSLFTLFLGRRAIRTLDDVKGCDPELFRRFFTFLLERGIYFSPSQYEANFISSVHTLEHLQYTQEAILEFLLSDEAFI